MDPYRFTAHLVPTAYIDFLQSCIHLRTLTKQSPIYTWRTWESMSGGLAFLRELAPL